MNRAIFCVVITLLTAFGSAKAQNLSGDPEKLIEEVTAVFETLKNEEGLTATVNFSSFWSGGNLNQDQQKQFAEHMQTLRKKKWKPNPYFILTMEVVQYSVQNKSMNTRNVDTLLICLDKVVEKYSSAKALTFLNNASRYVKEDQVYAGPKSSTKIQGGSFKIKFVEDSYVEEEYVDIPEETESEDTDGSSEEGDWEGGFDDWDDSGWDDYGTVDDDSGWGDDSWGDDGNSSNEETSETEETENEGGMDAELTAMIFEPEPQPIIEGPVIEFENVDVIISSRYDTATIKQTSGSVLLAENLFVGQGGSFDWTPAGLTESEYVELQEFNFKTNDPSFSAEAVTLHYDSKIEEPVQGIMEYKADKNNGTKKGNYPRFMSYNANVVLKDLGENIQYHGGFSLKGQSVRSSSLSEGRSSIVVNDAGEEKFKAKSKYFEINDSIITAKMAQITLYQYHHEDSLTHPGANLKFNNKTKDLAIYVNKTNFKNAPIKDSYHMIDINVDAIFWNIHDTTLHFTMTNAKNERPAFFNSTENFQETKYLQLKGLYPFHPLQMIQNYSTRTKKTSFFAADVAKMYKQNPNTVKSAMSSLMRSGYIDYSPNSGLIVLKDKVAHSVDSRRGKIDFDVLSIESVGPADYNATLNLSDEALVIRGVKRIQLSDTQYVHIEPRNGIVKLMENRKMVFDGVVYTNNYIFNGREFTFDYEEFSVDLAHIDSIKFQVLEKDDRGRVIGRKVLENKLSYSSGKLLVDHPDNKSGRESHPDFPHFDADRGASVVFNQKEVLGGAYDTTIKYKIPPFAVDSLSNSGDQNVSFEGSFQSGGIFPDIDQKLVIMDDFSFGFNHETPAEGYPVFGGKGTFTGTVSLSKKGIRGNGSLKFLNTTVESEDFVFYKDSVQALGARSFTDPGSNPKCNEGVTFPSMTIDQYEMHWLPNADSMFFKNFENNFKIYKDGVVGLNGNVVISPNGMTGSGIVESQGALTISQEFLFQEKEFTGRNSEFEILTDVANKPALRSDMVKINIKVEEGMANFTPEAKGFASNEFPFLKYKSSIDDGVWDINKRTVTMSMPEDGDISESYFYSTKKNQDSLVFNAEKAIYLMDSLKLIVSGVPYINIADSKLYPKGNTLSIKENAVIETLDQCEMIIDTINEYHHLSKGRIKILSRFYIEGQANYDFINYEDDTIPIIFSDFDYVETEVDKKASIFQTVGKGNILEEDTFFVAPRMRFKGVATMYSPRKRLYLDGFIQLDLHGQVGPTNWLKYESQEDVEEVRINLDDQVNKTKTPLITGIHYSNAKKDYYATFLSDVRSVNDQTMMTSNGILFHDEEKDQFAVVSKGKLEEEAHEGQSFRYNEEEEKYVLFGTMKFLKEDPQRPMHMDLGFSGWGLKNSIDSTFEVNGMTFLRWEIPDAALIAMGKDLGETANNHGLDRAVDPFNLGDTLLSNMANFAGSKAAEAHEKASMEGYTPLFKTAKLFSEGLVLNDLNLVWNKRERAWYSNGRFNVMNSGSEDVNSVVNGYIEIKKGSLGDNVNVYIEVDAETWFYLSYNNGSLFALSSYAGFNEAINEKSNMDKNLAKGLYYFTMAEEDQKERYIKHFVDTYLGGVPLEEMVESSGFDPMDDGDGESEEGIDDDYYGGQDDSDYYGGEEDEGDDDYYNMEDEDFGSEEELEVDENLEEELVDPTDMGEDDVPMDEDFEGTDQESSEFTDSEGEVEEELDDEERAEKEEEYDKLIKNGDKEVKKENYEAAKSYYEQAEALLPGNGAAEKILYVSEELADIAGELEELEEVIINDGFDNEEGDFESEETSVEEVVEDPTENFSIEEVVEEEPIDEGPSPEEIAAEKQEKYDNLITEAEQAFEDGEFESAQLKYKAAGQILPENGEHINGLEEIETELARIEAEKEAEKAAAEAEAAAAKEAEELANKQKEFDDLLKDGDKEFKKGNLEQAKLIYAQAEALLPDQGASDKLLEVEEEIKRLAEEAAAAEEEVEEEIIEEQPIEESAEDEFETDEFEEDFDESVEEEWDGD